MIPELKVPFLHEKQVERAANDDLVRARLAANGGAL